MTTLADLREQYPELQGLDDDGAIDAIQQAFYPEIPRETIAAKLGYKPPEPPRQPSSAARRMIGDSAVSLAKGVIAVPEAAVGVADLVTGGRAGRMAEAAGFRPREAKEILSGFYSPEQQEAFRQVQAAEGIVDTAGAVVRNPSVIPQTVIESLPAMGAGGTVGQVVRRAAPAVGPVVAGAAGEGVVAAGMGAEQVRQESPDGLLTPGQSGIVAASGAATGALGLLGGKIAQSLGIADVDTMLAGAARSSMARKSVVRRAVEGFVAEGLLEELPQSLQEQIAQNAATGKPLDEGIDQAAVLGVLSGGVMGAAAQMLPARGPLTRAANAGIQSGAIPVGMPGVEPVSQVATLASGQQVDAPGLSEREEAAALGAMERQNSADTSRFGQPRIDDWRLPEAAPDFGPTDPAFVDEMRAQAERDQAAAVEDMQAELRRTRVAEAMAAPVERAPRRRIEAQELDLPGPDPVRDYIDAKRAENTPAARAFVKEFEAGRITPADVQSAIQRGREPTPDERLASASQQRVEPDGEPSLILNPDGQPFRNQMAVRRAQRSNPNTEIEEVQGGWALRPVSQTQAIETAANEAATSAANDRPEPSQAQKEAGNYKLGHASWNGLGLSFENPKGSERKGVDRGGKRWSVTMPAHYGYVKRTTGADGDHVDVYMGDKPESGQVFVVDQQDADNGKFDEHKVILGTDSLEEATALYDAGFSDGKGPQRRAAVTPMSVDDFKAWLQDGDTTKPLAQQNAGAPAPVGADGATVDGGADTPAAPAPVEATDDTDQQERPAPEGQAAAGEAPAAARGDRPAGEAEPAAPGPAAVQAPRVKKAKAPKRFEEKAEADARAETGPRVEAEPATADTGDQETPDDPAPPTSPPPVDRPVDEGQTGLFGDEPVRGARQPRARAGRADDRGLRGARGRAQGADDGQRGLGDGAGDDAVSDRPDGAVERGGRGVSAPDYRPEPGGLTREGSWFATAARNIDLIELAIRIDGEKRAATPDEQAQLSKYVGFGASEIRNNLFPVPSAYSKSQEPNRLIWPNLVREARWKPLAERMEKLPIEWQRSVLQSSQYAHYTSEGIIRSVWSGMQRMGFTGGKVLEPGMGIGSFAMLMPENVRKTSKYTGVEFDGPTALIARLLSPQQNMLHEDFIKRKFPRDYFDVAVGNPPFSQTKILGDPDYEKFGFMLHDFFFAKSLDRVRPGGLLVFVTSKGTMDKQSDKARKYLADRADLLGAIRLPSTAFEANAGTSVVTDVIFLRKRLPGEAPAGKAWQAVKTIDTKDGPAVVNEYFADHPEMVLGQQRISGNTDDEGRRINSNGMGGEKYTVVSYDKTPAELDAKFAAAIERLPANAYSPLSQTSEQVRKETAKVDFDPSVKREGVVYLGKGGALMRVEQGVGKPLDGSVKLSEKDAAWFKGYVGIRDAVQAARAAQVQDGDWQAALKALNKAYDAFREEHGPVNDFRVQVRKSTDEEGNPVETEIRIFKNRRLFREDYDSAVVTQLETITEGGDIIKAPFLLGRTIGKPVTREVKTIGDALAVSLDETGRLDLDDVARRIHITRAEAIESLGNQVFKSPQGDWQLADEYLSGDVVTKLEEAEQAARLDASLDRNVEALKAVQPEKLGPSQISVKAGASWVPARYVSEFASVIGAGAVTFDPKTESWQVEGGNLRSERKAGLEYGTTDRSPSELLEAVLNSQSITIKKTDADKKTYTDTAATTAANEAARKIKDKFKSWVWTDADRASELVESYNKRFNNIAPRRFDGSHMTLPGVSLRFSLHPHQKRAIWRQVQTGNTYLAHAVGAGKTIEMIAGGMEQKRLGLIRKPIYSVPNHMLEQFANEFMELYPLANIMVADDENFSAERRKAFVAAATLNAPDAIIITHSAFERVGVKEETVAPIRDEILLDLQMELDEAKGDRVRRSQLEQQIEAVTQRFDSIAGVGKKDSTIKFEDIGADFVYVDEAHAFRKLDFTTNQKIKGIDPNGSRRALDMYVKTRWLEKERPGRAMVFASGTPVTNTMGELYTIMRFFAPDELARGGISTFDGWARQFGEAVPALEANAAGRYEVVERFAKFDNVPELMSRVRQFMDVLTSEHLGALVKRPDIEGGKPDLITVEPTAALKSYMKTVLLPRLEASRKWKPTKDEPFNPDPVIAITSDGRFAALDPRFFGETIDEDRTPTKLSRMADEVARIYKASAGNEYTGKDGKPEPIKGSTQIVFYNLGFGVQSQKNGGFDARAALNRRMVAQGVKREHILWFDDADTDAKKESMFKAMRSGQARILVGSAKKMGTGVNVQKRLLALHYFDPPWYPSDVEQPHGRIIRQGNQNEVATIKWYATKGTYDSTMWQMVGRKQRFIDQAFSGDKTLRSMEDMSEASMFEQAAAVASGDPRALQLAGLRQDVERLERLQAAHASEQISVRSALRGAEWNVDIYAKRVSQYAAAVKAVGGSYYAFKTGTVGNRTFEKQTEFGQAVKDAFNRGAADAVVNPGTTTRQVGSLAGGLELRMEADADREGKPNGNHELVLRAGGLDLPIASGAAMDEQVDALGLARRIVNAVNGIDADLSRARSSLSTNETDVTRLRKKLGAPFEYQQELAEKYGDLKRLEEELRAEGEAEAKAAAAAPAAIKIDADGKQGGEKLSIADDPAALDRLESAFSQSFGQPVDGGTRGADTPAYGPATQAHRDVAATFRERIGRAFPGTLFDAVAPGAGPRSRELAAAATVAKRLFGQEVVFVRFDGAPLFNGAMSDSIPNTVFLRADSTRPHLAVLGHELLHRMRKDQPGIYQGFTKRIDALLNQPGRYLDALRKRYKDHPDKVPADWMEELRADIVGDFFVDREFWQDMADQQPGLFRRVVTAIVKFLDDVAAFLTTERPFGTEKFLADVQIARGLVADAMRQYSGAQVGAMTNQSEGISLSIADMADSLRTTATKKGLTDLYNDLTRSQAGFNWWHKTIGTQYAKAKRNADFAKVYDGAQDYLHDTSAFANDAGGRAPDLLPQLKGWQDILRPIALKDADRAAVSKAVFEGTLNWSRGEDGELTEDAGDSPGGVVFTDAELAERFGMTEHQRDLYRQFRAATDRSLDLMAAADVARYLADDLPGPIKQMVSDGDTGRFKGLVMAMLQEQADKEEEGGYWTDAMAAVEQKYERIDDLKARGYAPLMRFGKHSVYVTRQTDAGTTEQVYFGLYETQREANQAAREFKATFKDEPVAVQQGLLSEEGYKLFSGMSPETMAVFADLAGMERNEQFEAYLKLALANRSALKRLIRRKGVAGYSEDLSRVLASFVTSNARAASSSLHMGDIAASIGSMQERKVSGDVIDEAIKLKDYVQNPGEEAQAVRGLLFVQYLGGSVASAIVNMTQPATMTFPFLSQFGGPAKAAARLVAGIKQAVSTIEPGSELGRALAKAEKEGIVSPQEIHQLQAEAARNVGNRPWVRKTVFLWGSLFSLAEQFNRRSSFIAAWNTAKEEGIADPFAFAADAVDQTQGVYNKANKPNWARGALGGTLFTFKQFSISYLEFLSRLPPREKALALAVLMLAAGAQGLPGADDLDDLIDTMAQQAGYDFDSREAKARFLTSVLGRGGADFLMHGFSAIPGFPLDVSSRLSVGNLIPGTSLLMKSEPDKGRGMQEILGPAGGFGADLMKMVEQRDVLLAVPVAIRNLAKGLDMMQTSQYSDSRGRKVIETGPVDAVTKMVGFQPADVARESRRLQDRRQRVALVKAVESEIAAEWAGGIVDGKPERVRAARERLQAWNRDNPQSPIAISSGQIGRRVRDMRMTREERFMKTVPRELRQTLQ